MSDNRASCGCPTYWVEDKGKPYGDCPYCEIDRLEKELKELREALESIANCNYKNATDFQQWAKQALQQAGGGE